MADYVSSDYANTYFQGRLHSEPWDNASDDDRRKALVTANRAVERLSYVGQKLTITQTTEWPRQQDAFVVNSLNAPPMPVVPLYNGLVPDDILVAVCEIAFSLLDGVDITQEIEKLNILITEYARIRTEYDRTFTVKHIRNLIPSAVAWAYLVPYLRDDQGMRMIRI